MLAFLGREVSGIGIYCYIFHKNPLRKIFHRFVCLLYILLPLGIIKKSAVPAWVDHLSESSYLLVCLVLEYWGFCYFSFVC